MKLKKDVQKICCFYASDWHLTVMLLPYISKKIKENASINMKCENNIEEKINILLNKLELKNKKDILNNINLNNLVAEDEIDESEILYIVSGSMDYIEDTNENIVQYYKDKEKNVKIINCYEVNEESDLVEIIDKNNYTQILNTSGECDIEEGMKL